MLKSELKAAAEVMLAAAQGATIQGKFSNLPDAKWKDFPNPSWDWEKFDYRVKPALKYRPFKDADEAFQEAEKHGFWIKTEKGYFVPLAFIENNIYDGRAHYTFDILLAKGGVWADDGTPCGILEESSKK